MFATTQWWLALALAFRESKLTDNSGFGMDVLRD
jgi:hypothetical protein